MKLVKPYFVLLAAKGLAIAIELPDNAQKLIEYTNNKGNDRYYLALEWDSNNDGKWDIGVDYNKKFDINIYTSKRQTVYLKQIEDYRTEFNSLTLVNYCVKPNEQKASLLALCHSEQ